MTTTLRQVLQFFQDSQQPLSLTQAARDLDMSPGMLQGMIDHWVRKGHLRETSDCDTADSCGTCGGAEGCPFVGKPPRRYELATGQSEKTGTPPVSSCSRCG